MVNNNPYDLRFNINNIVHFYGDNFQLLLRSIVIFRNGFNENSYSIRI